MKTIEKTQILDIYNNYLKDKNQSKPYKANEQFIINLLFITILKIYNENVEFENIIIKDEIDIIDTLEEDGDKHRFTIEEVEHIFKKYILQLLIIYFFIYYLQQECV